MTDGLMQTGGTSRRVTIRFSGLPNSGFIINKGQSCGKKMEKCKFLSHDVQHHKTNFTIKLHPSCKGMRGK